MASNLPSYMRQPSHPPALSTSPSPSTTPTPPADELADILRLRLDGTSLAQIASIQGYSRLFSSASDSIEFVRRSLCAALGIDPAADDQLLERELHVAGLYEIAGALRASARTNASDAKAYLDIMKQIEALHALVPKDAAGMAEQAQPVNQINLNFISGSGELQPKPQVRKIVGGRAIPAYEEE